MLIALYYLVTNALPKLVEYVAVLVELIIVLAIMLSGINMMLRAVGIRMPRNSGYARRIFRTIFKGMDYLWRKLSKWIRLVIHYIFNRSRSTFIKIGVHPILANVLSSVISIIIII